MNNISYKENLRFLNNILTTLKNSIIAGYLLRTGSKFTKASLKNRALIAIFLLLILPAGFLLVLIEFADRKELLMYMSLHFSLCIAFCSPIANWLNEWLVNRKLREMNKFCVDLKRGKLNHRMDFFEKNSSITGDELIRLQQNLNWLAHSVARREYSLTKSLTETYKDKEKLNLLSYTDYLTGLFNKRFFELKIVESCSKCISCKTPLHLMMIDCDHFKEVNDQLGHMEGDRLLAQLGQIINSSVRTGTDFPFRFGGDEFGAILVGIDSYRCEQVAERIRLRFAELSIGRSSLSIGISRLNPQAKDPEAEAVRLVETADKALYFAKNTGRDKVISPARI
ncbi:diguanylate cyclase (GGDEF) domain-containing protein [Maridesulfovibrio ferrireducens]|uniref:diguanylate cyclase n=1 Tax=Maridesulfovibrio ferrireducens TaxID=246191 RepID=A0A1G9GZ36_9BACT|nr:GGDEF domain-containing protein [Maridesulfovibrio ferrireducens]SDL05921.1 diguanylate cyclase (GGDEF) domain-containing protein [Maridesulfovibrio ferrireducens]